MGDFTIHGALNISQMLQGSINSENLYFNRQQRTFTANTLKWLIRFVDELTEDKKLLEMISEGRRKKLQKLKNDINKYRNDLELADLLGNLFDNKSLPTSKMVN